MAAPPRLPSPQGGSVAGRAGDAVRAAGERRRRRPRAVRAGGGRGQHGGQVPRLRPGGRRQRLQLQEGEVGGGRRKEGGRRRLRRPRTAGVFRGPGAACPRPALTHTLRGRLPRAGFGRVGFRLTVFYVVWGSR